MAIPMKRKPKKFITQSIKTLRRILAGLVITLAFFNLLPKAWSIDLFWEDNATTPATAGSGTWTTGSASGQGLNWRTMRTSHTNSPWTGGRVAHFIGSVGGTVTLSGNITAAGINFESGAGAFIIDTNGIPFTD